MSLTKQDLKEELGIKELGLRNQIMAKIDGLKPTIQSVKGLLDETETETKTQTQTQSKTQSFGKSNVTKQNPGSYKI